MKIVCDMCGNEWGTPSLACPFCGTRVDETELKKLSGFVHKTVNLEAGRPVVEAALHRMNEILEDAARRGDIKVLTLIHGYGSSGKGGAIRSECRKILDFMKSRGQINDYIAGEDFHKRSGSVKALIRRYPQLATDQHLNRGNRGITLVILSCWGFIWYGLVFTTILNATVWS